MNLRNLSNKDLLEKTSRLVAHERETIVEVLHHLREIERRMLYAEVGYPSLLSYCVRELKYSESAAYRRISAMRLIKEIPEAEAKIMSGSLTLNNATQAQVHFRKTKTKQIDEKKALLLEIESLSSRECERALAEKRGESAPPERAHPISASKTYVSFIVDKETEHLHRQLEIELGHSMDLSTLVKETARLSLQFLALRKEQRAAANARGSNQARAKAMRRRDQESCTATPAPEASEEIMAHDSTSSDSHDNESSMDSELTVLTISAIAKTGTPGQSGNPPSPSSLPSSSRYIKAAVRREVWQQCRGRCQYRDPQSGRQCEETQRLQIEHRIPYALGGSNETPNLTLLCPTHNRLAAVRAFGHATLQRWLPSLN
jgi:hypothetical protein